MTDVRGLDISRIMTLVAAEIDGCLETLIDSAANVIREHGGTDAEVEAMRDKMRAWLQRCGEPLN